MGNSLFGSLIIDSELNIVGFNKDMETLFPNIITGEKCYKILAENNKPCAVCPIMAKDIHSCAASDTCSCDDVSELSVTPQQKLYMLTFRSEALKAKVPSEI